MFILSSFLEIPCCEVPVEIGGFGFILHMKFISIARGNVAVEMVGY